MPKFTKKVAVSLNLSEMNGNLAVVKTVNQHVLIILSKVSAQLHSSLSI